MTEKKAAKPNKPTAKEALVTLKKLGETYSIEKLQVMSDFERMAAMGQGLTQIKAALEPLMPKILPLAGSHLGFITDKQYPPEVLMEAIAEAALRGYRPIGNEFNVIAGHFYAAKNGLSRMVKQYPGLTDLKMRFGVPKKFEGQDMVVHCFGEWKLKGVHDSLDTEIAVSTFGGNRDAAIGKATRKLLSQIYDRISGGIFTTPEGEVGDMDVIDLEAEEVGEVDEEVMKALEKASEPAEDPRKPKEGARPYAESDAPEQPTAPKEPPLKPLSEAMFGPQHGGKIDAAAVRRLAALANQVIGEEWAQQVAVWVKTNYSVRGMSELPASAETELMKWLDR